VLDSNPLPFVLVVVMEPSAIKSTRAMALVSELRALQQVEIVQFDQEWLLRLKAFMALAERGVWVFGALLALTVLLVIGNTIRLEIANRADEIQIVRLIGASNAFVRRPFLYSGFWFGTFGAGLAIVFVSATVQLLRAPVAALAASYGSAFELNGLSTSEMLCVLLIGITLGWLGALIASMSHLLRAEGVR
jgi:cell division transport system permease protein